MDKNLDCKIVLPKMYAFELLNLFQNIIQFKGEAQAAMVTSIVGALKEALKEDIEKLKKEQESKSKEVKPN